MSYELSWTESLILLCWIQTRFWLVSHVVQLVVQKLALTPYGTKAGILPWGYEESCQCLAFVLQQLPVLLLNRQGQYDHERADEAILQGGFNGVPGRGEQPNQCPRTYDRIQQWISIQTDLILKRNNGRRAVLSESTIEPAKQPSSNNAFQNSKLTRMISLMIHHQLQHKSWSWMLRN